MNIKAKAEIDLLVHSLNILYLRADTLARKFELEREHNNAQCLRECMGYMATAEECMRSMLDEERKQ